MTYRELRKALYDMTEEQLDYDLTVELGLSDEFFVAELRIIDESDVLDEDHPVIYAKDA